MARGYVYGRQDERQVSDAAGAELFSRAYAMAVVLHAEGHIFREPQVHREYERWFRERRLAFRTITGDGLQLVVAPDPGGVWTVIRLPWLPPPARVVTAAMFEVTETAETHSVSVV